MTGVQPVAAERNFPIITRNENQRPGNDRKIHNLPLKMVPVLRKVGLFASPVIIGCVTSMLWRRLFTGKSLGKTMEQKQLDPASRARSLVGNTTNTIVNSGLVCELTKAVELAFRCGIEIINTSGKSGTKWKVGTLV